MEEKRYFTLLQLLIFITLILGVAVIFTLTLFSAYSKSRDVKRVSDIRQMQAALNMYFLDVGQYPLQLADNFNLSSVKFLSTGNEAGFGNEAVGMTLMSPLPSDPKNTRSYIYRSSGDGSRYFIKFVLENNNDEWQCHKDNYCYASELEISGQQPSW